MGIVERLRERAKEDQACADNSKVIVDALAEQMRLFETREGHNVYAVRMAVDHKNSVERDSRYAADLLEAADEIERLRSDLSTGRRTALLEGRRQAFDEAGQKAREYAALYPEASDGRNTFIIFAEWAEVKL